MPSLRSRLAAGALKDAHLRGGRREERNRFLNLIDYSMLGLFYLCKALTYMVPPQLLYGLFYAVGSVPYYVRPGMRRDLLAKVADAMPEVTDRRRRERIARGACVAMVMCVLEGLLFRRYTDRIMRELRVEGMENYDRAIAEGKGVMVYSVHFAAVIMQCHLILQRLGRGYTIIAWDPENLPVARYARKMAELMLGPAGEPQHPVIFAGHGHDALAPMRETMTAGGRMGLVVDVPGKQPVNFFGRPAALADGIAQMSYMSGAPIVPVVVTRTGWGLGKKLTVFEPITHEPSGDRAHDIAAIMDRVAAVGESMVRQAPEQWMSWFGLWSWWDKAKEILEGETSDGDS